MSWRLAFLVRSMISDSKERKNAVWRANSRAKVRSSRPLRRAFSRLEVSSSKTSSSDLMVLLLNFLGGFLSSAESPALVLSRTVAREVLMALSSLDLR